MEFLIRDLNQSEKLENKIKMVCSFNHSKCSFKQGRILTIKKTNISFIEPHKIVITYKGKRILLLYFNENNLFLFNRTIPIDAKKLDEILKEFKRMVNGS